jgi:hypothetical protein
MCFGLLKVGDAGPVLDMMAATLIIRKWKKF